jgi:carbon monoxide dehydrogenase subunit G
MRYGEQAQVGSCLIDSTARTLADQFFDRCAAVVNPQGDADADSEAPVR